MHSKKPVVAIIGRVNTGKSTLFNCLIKQRRAITHEVAGTTRNLIHADCTWRSRTFELVDTGGLETKITTDLEKNVQAQVDIAIEKADIILFVTDVRSGLTSQDFSQAKRLRKITKPVILVVNKADSKKLREKALEFYRLGLGKPQVISAISGVGTGDLLDVIASRIEKKGAPEIKVKKPIKVGLFGKPNVGKSSLLNALLGETRVLVSEMPGTTRDIVDTLTSYRGNDIILVDTAGIKRRAKIKKRIEKISIQKSLKAIEECSLALLILDATSAIARQDLRIAKEIVEHKKGIILVVNKWDLIESGLSEKQKIFKMDQYIDYLQSRFPQIYWAPVIFVSAKTKKNVSKILDIVLNVDQESKKVISKDELAKFLSQAIRQYPPPFDKRRKSRPQILKMLQVDIMPPKFSIHLDPKDILYTPYLRYLEKKLREKFKFTGTPIVLQIVKESKSKASSFRT